MKQIRLLLIFILIAITIPFGSSTLETQPVQTGESVIIQLDDNQHTFEAVSVPDSSKGTFRLDGELYEKQEGVNFSVEGYEAQLVEVVQTNSDDSTGYIEFGYWAQSKLPVFCSSCKRPNDLDKDGLYEDVNGDTNLDSNDTELFFDKMSEQDLSTEHFDFNQDGVVDVGDAQKLQNIISQNTGISPLCDNCGTPTDPDNDGLYEDIDGDGDLDSDDTELFFDTISSQELSTAYFDFNQDGSITSSDVTKLDNEINSDNSPAPLCESCNKPTDIDGDGLYEDVNGDGQLDYEDVKDMLDHWNSLDSQYFDFNANGEINRLDLSTLYNEIGEGYDQNDALVIAGVEHYFRMDEGLIGARLSTATTETNRIYLDGEYIEIQEGDVIKRKGGAIEIVDIQMDPGSGEAFFRVKATEKVSETPEKLCDYCSSPTDPDNDGLYEDIDGDGDLDSEDTELLFDVLSNQELSTEHFDFNQDGSIDVGDVQKLGNEADIATGIRPLCDDCNPPMDPDNDGLYEDVNGDGNLDSEDTELFFDAVSDQDLSTEYFDFNGDGQVDVGDVQKLENEINSEVESELANVGRIFSDSDVVISPGDAQGTEKEIANQLSSDTGMTLVSSDSSEIPNYKQDKNLVLIGGTAINPIAAELAENGDIEHDSVLEQDEARAELVEDAYAKGQDVVILRGYKSVDLKSAANEFHTWYEGESPSKLEGKKTYSWNTATQDSRIQNLRIPEEVESLKEYQAKVEVINPSSKSFEGQVELNLGSGTSVVEDIKMESNSREEKTVEFTIDSPMGGEIPAGTTYKVNAELFEYTGTDRFGNPGYSKVDETASRSIRVVNPEEKVSSIELTEGWNMISAPAGKKAISLEDINAECELNEYQGEQAWLYEGEWTNPSTVTSTQGVMVHSSESCEAKIKGLKDEEISPTESSLEKGWNMMSVPKKMSLEQLSGTCEFAEFEGAEVWHYADGDWEKLQEDEQLETSKGYYVKIKSQECRVEFNQQPPVPVSDSESKTIESIELQERNGNVASYETYILEKSNGEKLRFSKTTPGPGALCGTENPKSVCDEKGSDPGFREIESAFERFEFEETEDDGFATTYSPINQICVFEVPENDLRMKECSTEKEGLTGQFYNAVRGVLG